MAVHGNASCLTSNVIVKIKGLKCENLHYCEERNDYNINKKQTVSREMYLKAIYYLSQDEGSARSVDIAEFLGVSKPSVSVAMKRLSGDTLIEKDLHNRILLTPEGRQYAIKIIKKYNILLFFLVDVLEVDLTLAKIDADKLEHIVSDETISRIEDCCKLHKKSYKRTNDKYGGKKNEPDWK